jgi:UDP-N-acetyl-D-mannosaminuronic acid dehydrogenase
MGLAFKPDIDDLRESPALYLTRHLIADGLDVLPVEPNVKQMDEFELREDEEAINEADIIVFLVAHDEFKGIRIFGKTVFDFCGVTHSKEHMKWS